MSKEPANFKIEPSEVIARQAMRIQEIEADLAWREKAIDAALMRIVGIGGPLNDNRLGYTHEQIREWQVVRNILCQGAD